MKFEFGDEAYPRDKERRAQQIRALFVAGSTIQSTADTCVANGLWSPAELHARAMRAVRDEVRDALGTLDERGLPFAGPGRPLRKGEAPAWKQRELWSFDDYVYNFEEYRSRGASNVEVANRIAAECRERNGKGPKSLRLIEEDEPVL